MKEKGFTLIELLAVIVILAIIALIAVPVILNVIEKARVGSAESSALGYIDAVEKQISINLLDKELVEIKEGTYTVEELTNLGVRIKGTKPSSGEVIITSKVESATLCVGNYKVEYKNNKATATKDSSCSEKEIPKILYKENILKGADPVLGDSMIPVTIENDGTVKKADLYSEWYNYNNKSWANAVILIDETKTYEKNEIIPESNIESYFVWIPRYKYKLWNVNQNVGGAREIEIVYENKETPISKGTANGEYLTHPVFTTFNTNGMWVGKFETGYSGATKTTEAEITSSDSSKIIIKPNVYSWRNNTVYNMFVSSYNYKRELDSHMMKNTEWGAVVYLSHSKYGINKEVNINNDSNLLTGKSSLPSLDQKKHPGTYGTGDSYNLSYNTETGYLASTTGNITGIYDMNGGALEYVAAYRENSYGVSGFNATNIKNYNNKYFDIYNGASTVTTYQYRILGDATGEIGPFTNFATPGDTLLRYHNSWYTDYSVFVESTRPWFVRGGHNENGIIAGQFGFMRHDGQAIDSFSSRLVLTP